MSDNALKPLTKSRFKVGHECPRKLFYKNRPQEYQDSSLDDEFLKALAEGGFQVGALANLLYGPGHMIEEKDYKRSLEKTSTILMENESVTIFEAALGNHAQFVRVDILRKTSNSYELIETKAKSIESIDGGYKFWDARRKEPTLSTKWEPYLIDVAYQTWVARKFLPKVKGQTASVTPYLLLADKSASASVDGLNQMFRLVRDANGSCSAIPAAGVTQESVGTSVLIAIDVTKEVEFLMNRSYQGMSFDEYVDDLTSISLHGVRPEAPCDNRCKQCEFRVPASNLKSGHKSGFIECWSEKTNIGAAEFEKPMIFDLYQNRNSERQIAAEKFFLHTLEDADLLNADGEETSYTPRQRIQIEFSNRDQPTAWMNPEVLKQANDLTYPLHFIDFETCMPALPFLKGRRPYEQIVFQFSHHIVEVDGSIRHASEFLETTPGKFPNFEFVRALRAALGDSGGTVLRYSDYENTVLNQVRTQLKDVSLAECPDRDSLVGWIEDLAKPTKKLAGEWQPTRPFVDMLDWIENAFFYPSMRGSISIKKVLPALLEWSPVLSAKYSEPIYGKGCGAIGGIESRNFEPVAWVRKSEDGKIVDPYKNLPPLFPDFESEQDQLFQCEVLKDGAAAMTAYQRLQFSSMSERERSAINSALLRYCELDTLAMVMIWQALELDG